MLTDATKATALEIPKTGSLGVITLTEGSDGAIDAGSKGKGTGWAVTIGKADKKKAASVLAASAAVGLVAAAIA